MRDFKKIRALSGLDSNECVLSENIEPEFVLSDTQLDRIIREVFSVNPRTGIPNGDLAYYLSPDGNPQIKDWLTNNLLKPRVTSKTSLEGVTDDMIVEFSRKSGESVLQYAERLNHLYADSVAASKLSKSE